MPLFHTTTVTQVDETSSIATITVLTSSITSAVILAANTARKGACINNKSTARLYLALSATATAAAFTVPLESNDYWEVPFQYTGIISGIWATANGNAVITEFI